MPKKSLASIELAAIVKELEFLKRGKISQIYHQDKKEFLFQLHASGHGKVLLKIIPGKLMCMTDAKDAPLRPSGFCMLLRKYLANAFIADIYQKDTERIVVFELEKTEKYFVVVELFSKGNVVLCDASWKIIGCLDRQIWKDRVVKPGEVYVFPEVGVNWKTIEMDEFAAVLRKSEKKNVATSLATEIGLGGLYAEEACKIAGVDKDLLPASVDAAVVFKGFDTVRSFKDVKGYFFGEEICPFPLRDREADQVVDSYNAAINTLNPLEVVSPYQKKIHTLKGRIKQQEEAIESQVAKIEKNRKKGELIYENYAALQKLLDVVSEMKKDKEWSEIGLELKKEKKIKSVDLRHKKIVIDL